MQTTPQGGGSQGVKSAAEDSSFYLLIVNPLANKCKTGIPFLQLLYIHRIMLNCKNIPTAHFFTHSTQSL
jgi:hypothetical protein